VERPDTLLEADAMSKPALLSTAIICAASLAFGQEKHGWTQLSLSTCRVDDFRAAHPESDGRGVVIAIMDTGVDPSIPGLTQTPDGAVKVIDLQDFTGDGDVELEWIHPDPVTGKLIRPDESGEPVEYTPPEVPAAPAGEQRRWWFGMLNEHRFVNADQPDLNGNGTTDDKFPVLVTALSGDGDDQAACYVDTNLDRSFADEKPLQNYKLRFDTFTFHRDKPESEIAPMTFAVNIFLRQEKVVFQFDNGAHGTHVAGIAAGYHIDNQDHFDGVAPGAKVIGLKIGMGALGSPSVTESMKKAVDYAARFAREHDVPVVCNLSFGVDSVIEGDSDIDQVFNKALRENPYLVFCTSAGNSGAGLSTVGTPAAASEAITVGALLAADTARDAAGYTIGAAVVTPFSSRGGELDKPDIVTPGWSTSTVPRWVRHGDFWSGTSMASPYAAGLCAVLISHALHEDPGAKVRAWDVRRALCLTAVPVPDASVLDMGYGVPDLPKAAEVLARLLKLAADDPVLSYDISTPCPLGHNGRARAAYWRSTYYPQDERQAFTISPVFAPTPDDSVRASFTRKYTLRSQTPWCRVPQETIYLHAEQSVRAFVEYDPAALTEPGLHVGVVEVVNDGLVALRLINSIIVPYLFGADVDFTRDFKGQLVKGWAPERYFIAVPPGASSLHLVLSAPEGQESKAALDDVFDPTGRSIGGVGRLDTTNGRQRVERTLTDELTPGVWEVPIVADRPDKQWPYDLKVRFFGLHADPQKVTPDPASKPAGELTVTNMFEKPIAVAADGQIEGFRTQRDDHFKGLKYELKYPVSVDARCDRLRLHLEMTPEDYATTTDIAVLVKDPSGVAIYKSAFEGRIHEATVDTEGKESLELEIVAGFAIADDKRETPITVKIDQLFAAPVTINVSLDGEANILFIPGVPIKLDYAANDKIDDIPGGERPVGFLRFRERSSNAVALRVLVDIGA
jgi:tripeptidyl-peptidase-2